MVLPSRLGSGMSYNVDVGKVTGYNTTGIVNNDGNGRGDQVTQEGGEVLSSSETLPNAITVVP